DRRPGPGGLQVGRVDRGVIGHRAGTVPPDPVGERLAQRRIGRGRLREDRDRHRATGEVLPGVHLPVGGLGEQPELGEAERKLAHRVVHGASARPLPRRPTAVGKQGTGGAGGGDGAVVHTRTLAGEQRTGWPAARRACLTAPMVSSPKWNTLAASTASAPASTAGGKCSTAPAPPEAISG